MELIDNKSKQPKQPSAVEILLNEINRQKDYIFALESRINNIEHSMGSGIDYRNIRNTPNFIYDINKSTNDLVIKYYDGREVLIPLN